MGMDQYLLIPFLVGWTSIYQLFWGSLGTRVLTYPHIIAVSQYWKSSSCSQLKLHTSVSTKSMTSDGTCTERKRWPSPIPSSSKPASQSVSCRWYFAIVPWYRKDFSDLEADTIDIRWNIPKWPKASVLLVHQIISFSGTLMSSACDQVGVISCISNYHWFPWSQRSEDHDLHSTRPTPQQHYSITYTLRQASEKWYNRDNCRRWSKLRLVGAQT
jgi:hypothetical protein